MTLRARLKHCYRVRRIKRDGFTFIEVIASLALMGIMVAVFGMGLVAAMESYYFNRTNVDLSQKGQLALQRMIRELTELVEIRGAGTDYILYDRIEDNSAGIPDMPTMGLYRDAAGDLYLFSNLAKNLTTLPPADVTGDLLVNGVGSFSLTYYDANTVITDPTAESISTLRITLSLSRPDAPSDPHLFSTLVHLRNNGNNGGAVEP